MRRFGLFGKYLALIVALVTGALVVSSFANLWFTYKESKAAITALQREKAIAAAYRIEEYVRSIEHSITWTTLPRALEGVSVAEQRRIEFLKLLRQEPAITEVQWIDRHGKEQLRVSRLAMDVAGSGEDFSGHPRFLEARKGRTYFGPVYFRKETEPYMTVARTGVGQDSGVTAIEVNLKFVWDVVSQIKIGDAGLAYVVDDSGHLIAHPDISLVLQKLDWSGFPQVAAARKAAETASEQQTGLIARSRGGKEILTASAAIPTLRWLVVTEVPLAEAFAPLIAEIYRSALLLLIGFVLSIAASVILARRMVQPIRTLQEGAQRIGAGDLEHKLTVKTGDELERLAGEFNKMTEELRGSYAGLERKVEERTTELKEALAQLEVASQHKSQFLASMSHELRTPLNAILGFNEMILDQVYGDVPADMKEPLANIQASGKHLLRLINNVLDLAKIEAGRMELALADYSVHDVVESVRSTLKPLAADKGLELVVTLPPELPLAHGDSGRITQCLINLAGNSLKFTKAGKVEISVGLHEDVLTYQVTDTGIGIAPDKIGSLFTEFKQTDATIASEYGGTGLGLSISRKFVEMHGGRIWVESELGKGSAFIFEIPLRAGAGAQP